MSKTTEEIKSRADIVSIIGEYVQLKPAGTNVKGKCPFHNEKTPSFMVSREKQFWHCFGCNLGGDVFDFLMKIENLEFIEVLKLLAERTGVKLDNETWLETNKNEKNRLLDVLKLAAKFYHTVLLNSPKAEAAREYLFRERGLEPHIIDEWQIGYIPDTWDALVQFLLKKGMSINDILHAGLIVQKHGGGWYDRFRGRIMFPIADAQGNIMGFTGRILKEDPAFPQGKYVNTPQTPLYDKSKLLYGLYYAKKSIKEKGFVIVVEGQMDVIACHEHGMQNTVASSGTALTLEQVRLLKRFTNQLYLAFDADSAGEIAARRGIDMALSEGLNVRIIIIPSDVAKDPDECLRKAPEKWVHAVENALPLMEFYFKRILDNVNLNDAHTRTQAAKELIKEMIKLPDPVERDHWLERLAGILGISSVILREQMSLEIKKPRLKTSNTLQISQMNPPKGNMEDIIGRQLIAWCIAFPALWTETFAGVKIEALPQSSIHTILEIGKTLGTPPTQEIFEASSVEAREFELAALLSQDILGSIKTDEQAEETACKTVRELITRLNIWYTVLKRQALAREMEEAERKGDTARIQIISEQIKKLIFQ